MISTLISLALSVLLAAQSPNVPVDVKTQAIQVAITVLTFAQAPQIATTTIPSTITAMPDTQTQTTPSTTITPTFTFGATTVTQPVPPICTLTAQSNTWPAGTMINIAWTSDATDAKIKNNRVYDSWEPLIPNDHYSILAGNRDFLVSSEAGELNTFTAVFTKDGLSTTCTTTVMTQ